VLDPHKCLFLPWGTGLLLVRDEQILRAAHAADAAYLKDIDQDPRLPDYASLGPELTREWRGLRLWLPLHLHGVAAFRDALDEKLDLARWLHRELATIPELEMAWEPDLTVVGFRHRDGNAASEHLLSQVNGGRIALSSTRLGGECVLRLCPQGLRTHADEAATAVEVIRAALHHAR
jgi:glutamate/tyrosine decarboxylase-like PLP-dependent enzyme